MATYVVPDATTKAMAERAIFKTVFVDISPKARGEEYLRHHSSPPRFYWISELQTPT
jgi:hypothetical protein